MNFAVDKLAFQGSTFTEVHGDFNSFSIQFSQPAFHILRNAISSGAAYDSEDRYPPPKCHPQTRVDIRASIWRWIHYRKSSILWLHGPAGAGKSAVAQSICEECAERKQLLASFFFSRGTVTRRDIRRFIPTLAWQIAHICPIFKQEILRVLDNNLAVLEKESSKQLEELLIRPLRVSFQNSSSRNRPFLVVVDGLDECEGRDHQLRILQHLRLLATAFPLRFLVISRPEHHIHHAFETHLKDVSEMESLYGDIKDVYTYLKGALTEIGNSERHSFILKHVKTPWPGEEAIQLLTKRSEGYFIYASTIVKYVDEDGFVCVDRLNEVLDHDRARESESSPYQELDKLYMQVLSACPNLLLLRRILGCLILEKTLFWGLWGLPLPLEIDPQRGWTTQVITLLLDLRQGEVALTLRGLSSVVRLNEDNVHDIKFYHSSFQDFLIDKDRSGKFFVNSKSVADAIFAGSLRLLCHPRGHLTADLGVWIAAIFAWFSSKRPVERLVEELRRLGMPQCFMPLIVESQNWTASEQYYLLATFATMIAQVEHLNLPLCQDIIVGLSQLCNSALQMYLCGDCFTGDVSILTFYVALPRGRRPMDSLELELLLVMSNLSDTEQKAINRFRELVKFIDNSDEDSDDWDYSAKSIGCTIQAMRNLLKHFINNYRDKALFIGRRDTYFARLYLKLLTAERWSALNYSQQAIVRKNWMFYLTSSPANDTLLPDLLVVDVTIPELASFSNASRLLTWLKKRSNPPEDLVSLWEQYRRV